MGSPSASLATLRPELGTMYEFDLEMDRRGFIATRVAPVLEVGSQAGVFGKIPVEQLLETPETSRAPGSNYSRGNWKFTSASYATEEHGREEPVDDREARMYQQYVDAEMVATSRAYDAVLRNAEIRMASLIFNATTWGALTTAVGTEWSTAATATPIANIKTACESVWTQCGLWPNALIVTRHVFRNLRVCAEVIAAIAASGAGDKATQGRVTEQQLAEVFDLPYIIVAGGTKNTANKGQAATFDKIWDDEYAMVCRIAETNDVREPCIARTFHWGEDGSSIGGTVESYRDEAIRGDIIRVRHDVDELVMYTECGHLLSNITA